MSRHWRPENVDRAVEAPAEVRRSWHGMDHASNRPSVARRPQPRPIGVGFARLLLLVAGFGAAAAWHYTPVTVASASGASAVRADFGFCHSGGGFNCVVDGDTIWLEGQNIRIAGIDAPETHDYGCAEEKALGDRSTERLQQLVNSGAVSLSSIDRDEDVYGRKLRNVAVDGRDVGETLISEGLARAYGGGRRSWCG